MNYAISYKAVQFLKYLTTSITEALTKQKSPCLLPVGIPIVFIAQLIISDNRFVGRS